MSAVCDSVSKRNSATELSVDGFSCAVSPGETVAIDTQNNVDRSSKTESISKVWQLPLLAMGNAVDSELRETMEHLLAPIGRTKAKHFNERQIRSLGPAGALPLLAFALTEESSDQVQLRRTAVGLAVDLADPRAIEMLKRLALDPDPSIAENAERALQRIIAEAK